MLDIIDSQCNRTQLCMAMIGAYGILTHFGLRIDTNKLSKDKEGRQDVCFTGSRHLGCGKGLLAGSHQCLTAMNDAWLKLPAEPGIHANPSVSIAIVTVCLRECLERQELNL